VVVDDFPGTDDEEAAWQAALDQSGARRAVLLTPATGSQLTVTVQQGLDGAVADTLTSVLFDLGSSTLEPAALPSCGGCCTSSPSLIRTPRPASTDIRIICQSRAATCSFHCGARKKSSPGLWRIRYPLAVSRLSAAATPTPAAPNTPHGQPLSRRVVVVIDRVTGNLSAVPSREQA
jgi:hypothetical protein